jgi:hypothetical protein
LIGSTSHPGLSLPAVCRKQYHPQPLPLSHCSFLLLLIS